MLKRSFDITVSTIALLVLTPLLLLLAVWVKSGSSGPVLFRQVRVGQHGRLFRIYKYRTMNTEAERQGPQITIGRDPRVTRQGHVLRKYKLDELPQLLNVWLGHMSLVGPRPEVQRYMDMYPPTARMQILSVRPGITDLASIEFKDENTLLAESSDPQYVYIHQILPIKQQYYLQYVQNRSFIGDITILLHTIKAVFWR